MTRFADRARIGAEDAGVVRRAVFKFVADILREFIAVRLARLLRVADAGERRDAALERRVRLKSDDDIRVLIDDVAGLVRQNREDLGRVDVEDAALLVLRDQQLLNARHFAIRAFRRTFQERSVAVVLRVIQLNEVGHVDTVAPRAFTKTSPRLRICHFCLSPVEGIWS